MLADCLTHHYKTTAVRGVNLCNTLTISDRCLNIFSTIFGLATFDFLISLLRVVVRREIYVNT